MITRRTKLQLLVFLVVTVVGVTFIGGRYAKLDRLFRDATYEVVAHFEDSGGIFTNAAVSYRGVTIGQVAELEAADEGVYVTLAIDKGAEPVPARTRAVVANKSAVGEQYVDLQPEVDDGPFLEDGSEIPLAKTAIPITTTTLLTDISNTVQSVDNQDLRTAIAEFGDAFADTGPALSRIIDTGNSFLREADRRFDATVALIRDSNTVLGTQLRSASALRDFSRDLGLFSDTLVASDASLRRVIETGGATARQLRTFLERNEVDLAELINNLITTGEIVVERLPGVRQLLILYPYVVAGGYTVVSKSANADGLYDAHFGLVLTIDPHVCVEGYGTEIRPPQDRTDLPMNETAECTEPASKSNARGAQNAPRAGQQEQARVGTNRAPVVATYDGATKQLQFTDQDPNADVTYRGGARAAYGEDSWKWLLLGPLTAGE